MLTVNIHDAKTRLSELIARAVKGEPFIIAKAGKPMVKVSAIEEQPPQPKRRLGFAQGLWAAPDDFDRMGQEAIERMFHDGPVFPAGADGKGRKADTP